MLHRYPMPCDCLPARKRALLRGWGIAALVLLHLSPPAFGQTGNVDNADIPVDCHPHGFPPIATYDSAEDVGNGKLVFRLCDPQAETVELIGSVVTEAGLDSAGAPMKRDPTGMWSIALQQPLPPGQYPYMFRVNGVTFPDPRATQWVPGRAGVQAVATVRGPEGDVFNWRPDADHGAITEISYWSEQLGQKRYATVYTPPGYMAGTDAYPVLYLAHGAGGSHHDWTAVGNIHTMMDNLIADRKVLPFIIVMPEGHVPPNAGDNAFDTEPFGRDLNDVLVPLIDAQFRTIANADHRAMAGLSMGGRHTIFHGLPRPDRFHSVGIFSMGIGYSFDASGVAPDDGDTQAYKAKYGAGLKKAAGEMDLVWVGMGKDDFLHFTAAPLLGIMDEFGIRYIYDESAGGHSWTNWRAYFCEFAPLLFRETD